MNQLLGWLAGGDLRSDGASDQVVAFVLDTPFAFEDLYEGLKSSSAPLRGHVADALEKVARVRPDLLASRLSEIAQVARQDPVSVVRFHLVMLIGHLACDEELVDEVIKALRSALKDQGAFVRSWAIASLCTVGRIYPSYCPSIATEIAGLQSDPSTAVRTRARKALALLVNERLPFPAGWVKNERLKHRIL